MLTRTTIALLLCVSAGALAADQTTMPLPPGHPPIAQGHPADMPASAMGTLKIRAIQKTADGPSLAGDKVIVHFYQGDNVIKHAEALLDDSGEAVVSDVPLTPHSVQALVLVQHGRVTYQAASPIMNSAKTEAQVELSVYETTAEAPAWKIPMRHLIVRHTDRGVRVVEMLAVDNPTDRTWTGQTHDEEGATLAVRLPKGAGSLESGSGFSEGSLHFHNGTLFNVAPMTPGMTSYEFAYTIPVKGGKVEIPVSTPAVTQQLIVFVPNDGTQLRLSNLLEQGMRKVNDEEMRVLSGVALTPGQVASLTISGLPDTLGAAGAGWSAPQIVAASALAVVLLGGIGFMLLKPVKPRPETK